MSLNLCAGLRDSVPQLAPLSPRNCVPPELIVVEYGAQTALTVGAPARSPGIQL